MFGAGEARVIGRRNEGNVLFNDALNTFIYGYMASDVIWRKGILIYIYIYIYRYIYIYIYIYI